MGHRNYDERRLWQVSCRKADDIVIIGNFDLKVSQACCY